MYNYWGFGITITSEIALPELLAYQFEGKADVIIRIGKTPETIKTADTVQKVSVSISTTEYLLRFLHIANYYASNGNSIVVETLPGADERSVRLFLLSSVMAAILHQRNVVMLNASAVEYRDGILLFCGSANTGKSTMVSKLQQSGYKLFSDQACVLQPGERGFVNALPSYPVIKHWENTFAELNMPIPAGQYKIRPHLPKYAIHYHDAFDTGARPVRGIFILDKSTQVKGLARKKLTAVEAFSEVHNNIYHRPQIYPMKKEAIHFSVVSKLTTGIAVYRITRSEHEQTFNEVYDSIKETLQ